VTASEDLYRSDISSCVRIKQAMARGVAHSLFVDQLRDCALDRWSLRMVQLDRDPPYRQGGTCKGNCGRAGRGAERGTSRGSKGD